MQPKAPSSPTDADSDRLVPGKLRIPEKHLEEIASLSEKYLSPDAIDFSDNSPAENLCSLYELSRQEGKVGKRHAKRIETIVSAAIHPILGRNAYYSHRDSGGGGGPQGKMSASRNLQQAESIIVDRRETLIQNTLKLFADEPEKARELEQRLRQISGKSESLLGKTAKLMLALSSDANVALSVADRIAATCEKELDVYRRYKNETPLDRADAYADNLLVPEVTKSLLQAGKNEPLLNQALSDYQPVGQYWKTFTARNMDTSYLRGYAKIVGILAPLNGWLAVQIITSATERHENFNKWEHNPRVTFRKTAELLSIPEIKSFLLQIQPDRISQVGSHQFVESHSMDVSIDVLFLNRSDRALGREGFRNALAMAMSRYASPIDQMGFLNGIYSNVRTRMLAGREFAWVKGEETKKFLKSSSLALDSPEIAGALGLFQDAAKAAAVQLFTQACARNMGIAKEYARLLSEMCKTQPAHAAEFATQLFHRSGRGGFDPFTPTGLKLVKTLAAASSDSGAFYSRLNFIDTRCRDLQTYKSPKELLLGLSHPSMSSSDVVADRLNRDILSVSGKFKDGAYFLNGVACDLLLGQFNGPGFGAIANAMDISGIHSMLSHPVFHKMYAHLSKDRKSGAIALYRLAYDISTVKPELLAASFDNFSEFIADPPKLSILIGAYARICTEMKGPLPAQDLEGLKKLARGSGTDELPKMLEYFAFVLKSQTQYERNKLDWADELQYVRLARNPQLEERILLLPDVGRERVRWIFNGFVSQTAMTAAANDAESVAKTLALSAYKAQSNLQRISRETCRPCVAIYILSTGYGLRAPVPSMRQFDNQYISNPAMLGKAFARLFPGKDAAILPEKKRLMVKREFLRQMNARQAAGLSGLDARAERMKCSLSVASEWMSEGILESYIYQTAYKVASGGGGIKDAMPAARITDRISEICLPSKFPIVVVDHSTVRTKKHPTVVKSNVDGEPMGRAIAQIISRINQSKYGSATDARWLSVLNNWSVGDLLADGKIPKVIGFNLYSGVEYKSIGGRKSNWLPTDDKPFYVGRSWEADNTSQTAYLTLTVMNEGYKITKQDVTMEYWGFFRSKYGDYESQQRMDWAKGLQNVVLVDVDGTLIGAKHSYAAGMKKGFDMLEERLAFAGVKITRSELEAAYSNVRSESRKSLYGYGRYRDMELRFCSLLSDLSPKIDNEQAYAQLRSIARDAYISYIQERLAQTTLYPEAVKTLRKLNEQGYSVVLMTDRRDSELYDLLMLGSGDGTPIRNLVKGAIITNDLISEIQTDIPICRLGLPKEPLAYERITNVMKPVLIIGDSARHDLAPAAEHNIPGVQVRHGKGFEKVFEALDAAGKA